jgi:hypothetical protein
MRDERCVYLTIDNIEISFSWKMFAFCDMAPYNLIEADRLFICAYCLSHQGPKTSVCMYETTQRSIPKGGDLHTFRRENVKSHMSFSSSFGPVSTSGIIIKLTRSETYLVVDSML